MGLSEIGLGMLFLAQLLLFWRFLSDGFLSTAGCFVYMFLLFFLVRPLYLFIHDDFALFGELFSISVSEAQLFSHLGWATLGLCFFVLGSELIRSSFWSRLNDGEGDERAATLRLPVVSVGFTQFLLFCQVLSIGFIVYLNRGGGGLYGGPLGAYIYDFPMLLQAGHIFTLIVITERLQQRTPGPWKVFFVISGVLFLFYTAEMRHVSMFRGFYITGIMAAGIAWLFCRKGRVGYGWIVFPITFLLPFFGMLGNLRYQENDVVAERIGNSVSDLVNPKSYWDFFDSSGDMNIYDSYVAAAEFKPDNHPYFLSWLYVPVHFVPRALWKAKPEKGLLIDHDFTRGAPYSPGINGYFVLQGGKMWMLFCMFLLGGVVTYADYRVFALPFSYFKVCVYAILVINGLYLTRFLLYQSFYQVLYMVVPCYILHRMVQYEDREVVEGEPVEL